MFFVTPRPEKPSFWRFLASLYRSLRFVSARFWRHVWRIVVERPQIESRLYPEAELEHCLRQRGGLRLTLRADEQTPTCVSCGLCQEVCPTQAILIEADEPLSLMKNQIPQRFDIDVARCTFCALCAKVCPEDALRLDASASSTAASTLSAFPLSLEQLCKRSPRPGEEKDNKATYAQAKQP